MEFRNRLHKYIFGLGRPWYIPSSWCGLWMDKSLRQIQITPTRGPQHYQLSIYRKNRKPFKISLLNDDTVKTRGLPAILKWNSEQSCSYLEIEAGSNGIGPTYELYFWYRGKGGIRPALLLDKAEKVFIRPNIGLGLYGDWEEDLGVPWAWPLQDYKKL